MMKSVLIAVVSAVQAYLLGSIDTGILVSKFCTTMTCASTAAAQRA